MNLKSQRALHIFLASVFLLMGCDISTFTSPQQIPTPIPGAINLIAGQTGRGSRHRNSRPPASNVDTYSHAVSNPNSPRYSYGYADLYILSSFANALSHKRYFGLHLDLTDTPGWSQLPYE